MSGVGAVASNDGKAASPIGYYGVPVIHGPHWKWLIIGYFYFGGIAGSAGAIASIARLFDSTQPSRIGRIGTYVSFAALLPCPLFLIFDLGRPSRFLNMLRAFRPSSPMSMGSWGVAAFGLFISCSVILQAARDLGDARHSTRRRDAERYLQALAAPTGLAGVFVSGYTGVLLAATAVPIWSKRPAILGPLFLSSAMSSGIAAIAAVGVALNAFDVDDESKLAYLEATASIAEGSLFTAWLVSLGATAKPIDKGLLGYVAHHGIVGAGLALPLAISAVAARLPRPLHRKAALLASALTLSGVLALRYVVVEAGRQSANDPAATFEMTK